MDPLVSFLVENCYADNYRSAEKILECISDNFYDELVEQAIYESDNVSKELAEIRRKIQAATSAGNTKELIELSKRAKELQAKNRENAQNRPEPDPRKTANPRNSLVTGYSQTPKDGVRAARDPRTGVNQQQKANARKARELTGVGGLDHYSPRTGQVRRGGSNLDVDGGEGIQIRSDKSKKDNASGANNPRRINSIDL